MMDVGMSIAVSALHRQESRGAHSRPDFPARDDQTWLKHSLYYKEDRPHGLQAGADQALDGRIIPAEGVY
jgi:succinate dehydrogenase/fumarate reductase flavoprotein subunit